MRDQLRIFIADAVDEKARDVLAAEGFAVTYQPEIGPEELKASIGAYAALIVRSRTVVSAEVLAAGGSLRVVGRAGAGVDNIDLEEATRRGVVVMNTPGGNTVSTAEHTVAMMLALARNIPAADRSVRAMEWRRKDFIGAELSGKTLGLIGLGKVGQEVARRALAFEMRVLAYDPLISDDAARKLGVEPSGLQELYRCADFISLHTPLTPETGNLLNIDTLRLCRRGVRIINCARGGILNERDLLLALDEGIVAGAALDVFEHEPPADRALVNHPRIICTPHLGASTGEAQEKVAIQIARQVADFLLDRNVVGSVNADLIRVAMRKELAPILLLAEKAMSSRSVWRSRACESSWTRVLTWWLVELASLSEMSCWSGMKHPPRPSGCDSMTSEHPSSSVSAVSFGSVEASESPPGSAIGGSSGTGSAGDGSGSTCERSQTGPRR